MRKLMVLAGMLAMALVVASPAAANTFVAGDVDGGFAGNGFGNGGFGSVADDGGIAEGGDVLFVDVSQRQFALQTGAGDTTATANDGSVAFAQQDSSIYQSQFNAGFDGDSDDDGIFDEFDYVILAGDFDNDGIVDDFEF